MSTFRFTRLRGQATAAGTPGAVPAVAAVGLPPGGAAGGAQATFRFTRLRGQATAPAGGAGATFRFTRLRGQAAAAVVASVSVPASAEPFDTVVIDASATTGAAAWLLTQTGGAAVAVTGVGPLWSFEAPPTPEGDTVTFTVTAVGPPDVAVGVAVLVYPVAEYDLVGVSGPAAVWTPRRNYRI